MPTLTELLNTANVHSTLIVDDAYDLIPRVDDIAPEADAWSQFFDDITDPIQDKLREIFPKYDALSAQELSNSNEFLAALWENRNQIPGEFTQPFFARYETESATQLNRLNNIHQEITALGLTCETAGRDFLSHQSINTVNIILIDLYLGSAQSEADIELSIAGLTSILKIRESNPPLVLLMSSSPQLHAKRTEFRESTGLFESAFRVVEKTEILANLGTLLGQLASHYQASLKLSNFVLSWEKGILSAKDNVANEIRKLNLVDLAQVRQLLLNEQKEPTGSYFVDIFDAVLQFKVESEVSIIDSAKELNALNLDDYPAPYLPTSSDLQSLVYQTLFHHPKRLEIAKSEEGQFFFGDVLRLIPPKSRFPALADLEINDVMVVMTPACDLLRPEQGAKRVMFMVGTLSPFTASEWKAWKNDEIRTPVIETPDGVKHWIKWKPKHIETFSYVQLKKFLAENNPKLEVFARIRESHALELQQKLVSSFGRVGTVAPLPGKFPVKLEVCYANPQGELVQLTVPSLEDAGGICYVGKEDDSDMQLVISETICEEIHRAINNVDMETVHASAQESFTHIKTSLEFMSLGKGISLPRLNALTFKDIPSAIGATTGEEPVLRKRIIGMVTTNSENKAKTITNNSNLRKSGFILIVQGLN